MTAIETQLALIYEACTGNEPNEEQVEAIRKKLWAYELDEEGAVPQWFQTALTQLLEGEPTNWATYPIDGYDFSNLFSFMADIDSILPATFHDLEEHIIVAFPALEREACFWMESSQYQIRSISVR